jgi:two-component system chemotaxis response regulator CheY
VIPLSVLVVDDEPDMRLYVRTCLRGLGPRVAHIFEADDGLEALPLVRSGAVDLVIADVALPRLGGYGLCRVIKYDPELSHIVVLLISGSEALAAEQVGADGFLPKPFNASQLEAALDGLMALRPRPPPERPA